MNGKKSNVTRDELYQKVWAEPMSKVGPQYGVSGSYLNRICSELKVPTPAVGYWPKQQAGKDPARTPLPPYKVGHPQMWIRSDANALHTDVIPLPPPTRDEAPPKHHARSAGPHGLLEDAKEIFAKAKARSSHPSDFLSPRQARVVDILTSAENLDSSIAFAQKFFARLDDYGYRVVLEIGHEGFVRPTVEVEESVLKKPSDGYGLLRWSPRYRTIAYLGTVAIGLTIAEMTEEIKDSVWGGTKTVPSGRLRLQVYSPYRHTSLVKVWQDTKEASLRSQLDQIISQMEEMAQGIPSLIVDGNRRAEEELKRREAEHQEYLKRLDIDERKRNQKESRLALDELIASWAKVRDRRHFIAELEAEIEREDDAIKGDLRSRLAKARDLLGSTTCSELIKAWKTPEERYAERPQWMRFSSQDVG